MLRHLRLRAVIAAAPLLLLAAGCGEAAPEPAPTPPGASSPSTPSASATRAPPVTNIVVTVAKGRVQATGRRVKVKRGAKVRITVTSDVAEEFHLHGYDRTVKLPPGKPATLELTADLPGVFEAELHGSGARLFELQVG